jgi:hypothetical protein
MTDEAFLSITVTGFLIALVMLHLLQSKAGTSQQQTQAASASPVDDLSSQDMTVPYSYDLEMSAASHEYVAG